MSTGLKRKPAPKLMPKPPKNFGKVNERLAKANKEDELDVLIDSLDDIFDEIKSKFANKFKKIRRSAK
jgi:hypothetical protein